MIIKLEALGERRPPWPRQIITPILSTVKMLSLGGDRLTPKVLDHYIHHNLVMLLLLWHFFCSFTPLRINRSPPISNPFFIVLPGPFHKISSQSIHNFLSNVFHKQTNRQTNQRYQKHNVLCQGGNKYVWSITVCELQRYACILQDL